MMLNNLTKTLDQLRRGNARACFDGYPAEFLRDHPQMCCYGFDPMGTDIDLG
jgi:hypothetical protein